MQMKIIETNEQGSVKPAEIDQQWYAVNVVPQKEYLVAHMLRRQGLVTFIPTEIRTHKRSSYSNGKAEFAVPLISGVVFVGFPSAPAWYDVLKNDMIWGPIGMDGKPWRLDFMKLLKFFGGVNDGCMVFDCGLRLINIPGHAPVRSLMTKTRTISKKRRPIAAKPGVTTSPVAVEVRKPQHTDFLSRFVHGGTT